MQSGDILLAVGAILIFIGVMRLIYINSSNVGNYPLARWAMTGGLFELVGGFITGTFKLLVLKPDDNSKVCLIIYLGIFFIYLAL
ncbi:MAG: hypothetical protein KTR18_15905 [Acidiferrobacterales bacterium]|nr:hypothetical protein [Acidiferrobacterales bacterium]